MDVPIVLIGFNRPAHSARSLQAIAAARPAQIFFACDGPRDDHPEDVERCEEVRALVETIDWDCDVRTRFSEKNLGCGMGPISTLDWVFDQVDRAIIIEDDCVGGPDLLPFFAELLGRYRTDKRVGAIIGARRTPDDVEISASYTFGTEFSAQFGWATWARSWRNNDGAMSTWSDDSRARLARWAATNEDAAYWGDIFERAHREALANGPPPDYWDYQFTYAMWSRGQLVARPAVDLARNVGFGPEATHTRSPNDPSARIRAGMLTWPLVHPSDVVRDIQADRRAAEVRCAPWPGTRWRKVIRAGRRLAHRALPASVRGFRRSKRARS